VGAGDLVAEGANKRRCGREVTGKRLWSLLADRQTATAFLVGLIPPAATGCYGSRARRWRGDSSRSGLLE
jgi:hypothetical protein